MKPEDILRLMTGEQIRQAIQAEMKQMEGEGFDLAPYRTPLDPSKTKPQLIRYYQSLRKASVATGYKFQEPNSLREIRLARSAGPRRKELNLDPETLYDRIYGGWLGRVAGCVLGKPVEPFGYWGKIADYLKLANSFPLSNYIPRLDPVPDDSFINPNAAGCYLGGINGAPDDDDTDYTILALHIIETYGLGFTTSEVAQAWLSHLTYIHTYTAERTTYRNLIAGIPPEAVSQVLNPEREYIGARIRADLYGFVAPGNPELAAELAYRDASLSHTKNGIYSAMFMAAMLAWAFVTDDIEETIRVGLSEIPENCRQAEAIREVLRLYKEVDNWESAYERLLEKNASYHTVHAINNTVLMVLALLYGDGDFEKTICIAVMCGFDTDCNAANAGAVLGVITGAGALPRKWTDPLNDTLRSSVSQFCEMRISDLARRTARIAETLSTGDNHAI